MVVDRFKYKKGAEKIEYCYVVIIILTTLLLLPLLLLLTLVLIHYYYSAVVDVVIADINVFFWYVRLSETTKLLLGGEWRM